MSRIRDVANILSGGSSAIATDAEITSAVSAQFMAGKNKFINGDFNIWQRGTTFNLGVADIYTVDRFMASADSNTGTPTLTRQTFTPGSAPVAGYEGLYFPRITLSSSNTAWYMHQRIEDVRTFAGQTVTFSFWAKSSSNQPIRAYVRQNFGSGGSANIDQDLAVGTLTTSWQRFTLTFTLASISGKTIGTNPFLLIQLNNNSGVVASSTIDTWGWQLEAGSTATAFQTATGTIQGELAACQRYLPAFIGTNGFAGWASSTGRTFITLKYPVTARTAPTGITIPTISGNFQIFNTGTAAGTPTSINFDFAGTDTADLYIDTTAGSPTLVAGQGGMFKILTNGYILFTGCEL